MARKPKMTVQVRDKPGTDLGSFTTEDESFTYEIKAESKFPNVYLFEVDFGLGTLASVESVHPGQAADPHQLLAVYPGAGQIKR